MSIARRGRVRRRQRVVEEHHDAVAGVVVERALERGDDRPHRGVVVAEQRHHLFRLGALGKAGKAAQIAEHDDDLAAMAFEDRSRRPARRSGRRAAARETGAIAGALDLGELRGDARLKLAVPAGDLIGARAQFAEQPRILHRDHRLGGEVLEQRDLLVGEGPDFLAETPRWRPAICRPFSAQPPSLSGRRLTRSACVAPEM